MNIAVFGASGHGKVVADLAECLGYTVVFFDDCYPKKKEIEHWPILGDFVSLLASKKTYLNTVVAIGNNQVRQKKSEGLMSAGFSFPTLVHPSASVSLYATLSEGCVVLPGSVVNAFTNIAKGCIINSGAVVEHDCRIGDYTHICPNAVVAGGVTLGKSVWIGVGSSVRQLVTIGDNCFIGAGSVVIKDIPADKQAYGVPAAIVKDIKE